MKIANRIKNLVANARGTVTIETAIVVPVLAILTLGTFETSLIVARQHELQSAATEVEMIALATHDGAETNHGQLKQILRESLGVDSDEKITIGTKYRCGTSENLQTSISSCGSDQVVSTYIDIQIRDRYTPTWTAWGIGQPITFEVDRTVQVS